ncbi:MULTISPECIES: hypothetical protein [Mycobacterium avium complex (MAC)]|uniref:Uncharacterized protein n=1 Tax=Mycobacterium colombiense TaxID=339268 RepID=A0A329LIR2_9MYCO|nr:MULTISPECIES: hypothetical protein [Mycobacterium avium complex (MAC)]OBG02455.1 hypothetical protein A5769_12290 [Mycobacterium intracellulare]RAV08125.1 hypothetical protein DQP57_17400 [Mycobacterium colombiense]
MLNISLDRDTAVALIAHARQRSAADVDALEDCELEVQLRSVDIRRMLAITDGSTEEPAANTVRHNGIGLDMQLTPDEARVVADELVLVGDNLIRKALAQLDRGAVLDELMRAANGLLQRGNELLLAAERAENGQAAL